MRNGRTWSIGLVGLLLVGGRAAGDTGERLVFLAPGTDARAFGAEMGLTLVSTLRSDGDAHVFSVAVGGAAGGAVGRGAVASVEALRADGRVRFAWENERLNEVRDAFVPNDTFFGASNSVFAGFPGQWVLANSFVAGRDINVVPAWNRDKTGRRVTVGIVDDCLQISHPDLAGNVSYADSYDFGQNDWNPSPVYSSDRHGTSVAGLVAAKGGNGIGMTGVAPNASLAGLRVDFPNQTTAMFVDATLYRSSGSLATIGVKNHSYGVDANFELREAHSTALAMSAAAGTIHVFSAGNGRGQVHEDSNKKDYTNSPDVIAVAALGSSGVFASYSNFGANVFVTAPSSSFRSGEFGSMTTDVMGADGYNRVGTGDGDAMPDVNYTSTFGGTSAAAPLVAGVMALLKEQEPTANVRFAKHLLARTSRMVDAGDSSVSSDGGWRTNAAGLKFNPNYGFGLVDANALLVAAEGYSGVTPLQVFVGATQTPNVVIPDNNATGVSVTTLVSLVDPEPLEEVLVNVNISHSLRGDLEGFLTSPSGTTRRIFSTSDDSDNNVVWQFTMNPFWGELPNGLWTLKLADRFGDVVGTLNSWSLELRMGTLEAGGRIIPEPGYVGLLAGMAMVLGRGRRR